MILFWNTTSIIHFHTYNATRSPEKVNGTKYTTGGTWMHLLLQYCSRIGSFTQEEPGLTGAQIRGGARRL